MPRLIAFGCSFVQGVGLEQHITAFSFEPSKLAFPQLTADRIGYECVNCGIGGSSPKQMVQQIREFDFREDDIVIIHWPWAHRVTFFVDLFHRDSITGNWFETYLPNYDSADSQEYFKNYHYLDDVLWELDLYVELIEATIKPKVKLLIHSSLSNQLEKVEGVTKPEYYAMFPRLMLGEPGIAEFGTTLETSPYDEHPFTKHHHELCDHFYKLIVDSIEDL